MQRNLWHPVESASGPFQILLDMLFLIVSDWRDALGLQFGLLPVINRLMAIEKTHTMANANMVENSQTKLVKILLYSGGSHSPQKQAYDIISTG